MKTILLLLWISLSSIGYAQLTPKQEQWHNKYSDKDYTGAELSKIVDIVKFVPNRSDAEKSPKFFKACLLSMPDQGIEQLNRDANYLCAIKHEDYYEIWNMFYTKIKKDTWDVSCKALLALMLLDKTALRR